MPAPKGHKPYKGCETGGRPSKYSNEYIEKMADELNKWIKNESNYWLKDFAIEKDFDEDFLSIWAQQNEKFAGAYKKAKLIQESRIFKGGLLDSFNSRLVKFALVNHHGWVDKTESKISGDAANPFSCMLNMINGTSKDLVNEDKSK